VVSFIGVLCISVDGMISKWIGHTENNDDNYIGYPIFFAGVISVSFAAAFWSKHKNGVHWLVASWGRTFFGLLWGLLGSLIVDFNFPPEPFQPHYKFFAEMTSWKPFAGLLWMGILSGVIGVINVYFLIDKIGATMSQTTNYLIPAVGLIEGIFVASQWANHSWIFKGVQLLGTALVVIGLILTITFKKKLNLLN